MLLNSINLPLFVSFYRGGLYFQLFGGVLFGKFKKRTNTNLTIEFIV